MNEPTPDGLLLQHFLSHNDQESFRLLVERHGPMVLGTAGRVLGSYAEAEDVSQATFLALARKAHFFTGQRTIAGWLHRVAWQMALDARKSRLRREARERNAALDQVSDEPDPSGMGPELEAALARLPEKYRSVLLAHYSSGLTIEQTARTVGCSPSAASMRLTRGREKLRGELLRRGIGSAAAISLLAPALVPGDLTARTVLGVKALATSQQAGVGPGVLLHYWTRPVAYIFGHLKATAAASMLVAGLVVGLAVYSQSQSETVAVAPVPAMPTPEPSQLATKMEGVTLAGKKGTESDLIHLLLNGDDHIRLDFKQALDRNRLDLNSIRDSEGNGLLHLAVREGLENEMMMLLRAGASPNIRDAKGRTPLHLVLANDDDEASLMRDILVWQKADLEVVDFNGDTPLLVAVRCGNAAGVEFLLWLGADPRPKGLPVERQPLALAEEGARLNSPDANHRKHENFQQIAAIFSTNHAAPTLSGNPGQIPGFVQRSFTQAARLGDFDRLQSLIPHGARLNDLDESGSTALLQAISNQQADVVTYLLMLGANPNAADKNGFTPFMASSGWYGLSSDWMRNMLILAGANPRLLNKKGHNSLTFACYKGNEHAAQWAIWTGADPKAPAPMGTAMRVACQEGQQRIIDLLRRNGVTEPLYVEHDPVKRLILAARKGDETEILALLAQGVPVDSPDENGNNAVMNAIHSRRLNVARLLLQHGSLLDFENPKNGTTPLRATTSWLYPDNEKFRQEILEAGANPNQPDHAGVTPFIAACMYGDLAPKITQMLEHGAELNLKDKNGHTALWHSRQNGRTEAYEFLKSKGAEE